MDICGDKLLNETRNNLPPIYLPAISSNYSHIINFLNDKYDPNTFNQHRLLDFAVTVLLFSGNIVLFKQILQKHIRIFETYKAQNSNQLINYLIFCGIFQLNSFFTNSLDSLFQVPILLT